MRREKGLRLSVSQQLMQARWESYTAPHQTRLQCLHKPFTDSFQQLWSSEGSETSVSKHRKITSGKLGANA